MTNHANASLCVVIPIKSPRRAKQRLSNALSNQEREQLALQMFQHTLEFFKTHFPEFDVLVVSESDVVLDIARDNEVKTFFTLESLGLNEDLQQASEWVRCSGYKSQLIIPADIAVLDVDEITSLLAVAQDHQVVVAVAKDGGTNALLTTPPDAIAFAYGHQSAELHCQQAQANELSLSRLNLPHLSFDIDEADDLEKAVMQQPKMYESCVHGIERLFSAVNPSAVNVIKKPPYV